MKKKNIKELIVTVKYTVLLSDVEVSEDIYTALCDANDDGGNVPAECDIDSNNESLLKASEWLSANIHESDACDWEFDIVDIE